MGKGRAVSLPGVLYPGICLTAEEKCMEKPQSG